MRAGLSTILQTLTPEAASVLNQSIAEAARRNHSQTTPLHVAATLLASPSGLLRQACVRSHPTTSHPLQCRALELCFSVALDRLPSSSNSNSSAATPSSNGTAGAASNSGGPSAVAFEQPPLSNALMAALKRAQANQRRGCPEQQQQPLLAVKVELGQLVVSILDDPGVSRVMREASFSSPAVKATIEQSLLASAATSPAITASSSTSISISNNSHPLGAGLGGLQGFRPSRVAPATPLLPADRNLYVNPRLQKQQQQVNACGGAAGDGVGHPRSETKTPLLPANRSLYLNPRLLQQEVKGGSGSAGDGVGQKRDESKRVLDVLQRTRKRNPILVGDSQLDALMKEVLQRIEKRDAGEGPLRNAEVISLEKQLSANDKTQIPHRLQELANSIDASFKNAAAVVGVVLDLGDLKWLVEGPGGGLGVSLVSGAIHQQQQQQVVAEMGRAVVAEMAKLVARFSDPAGGRVWLMGTATCATYLRCQVYHPTMEADWDLQAVPIAPRASLPGMLPRPGSNGTMCSSLESLSHQKGFPPIGTTALPARRLTSEKADAPRRDMCPVCKDSYEHELAKLVAKEFEKSSSESKAEPRQPLPPWLQVAKLSNGNAKPAVSLLQAKEQELMWKQTTEELLKRWTDTCSRLHPHPHQPETTLEMPSLQNPNLLIWQSAPPLLQPARSCSPLQTSNHGGPVAKPSRRLASPPGSPVKTELVLGHTKPPPPELSTEKSTGKVDEVPVGFKQDGLREKTASNLDTDSFKRLFKGLSEKVSWQPEAATAVAATVIQCKSGDGRRRGVGSRGDAWLLFSGPDRVGKKKMAVALAEMVAGSSPVTVRFGRSQVNSGEPHVSSRGKTALDRVAEAVCRNPFSVVVLENIDHADRLVLGSLRHAMERGRLGDSHGREVALGSSIFILISDSLPEDLSGSLHAMKLCEEKLFAAANSGWELELSIGEKPGKCRVEWDCEEERPTKQRKQSGLSLDLNLAVVGSDEDATDSSRNSSDLTVEHEHGDCGRLDMFRMPTLNRPPSSASRELTREVDEAVVFKPVDFGELRRKVSDTISRKFKTVVGDGRSLCVDEEAVERVAGGVWFGTIPAAGFEEWTERVLVPGFLKLRGRPVPQGNRMVRLLLVKDVWAPRVGGDGGGAGEEWLPSTVRVAGDGFCGGMMGGRQPQQG